MDTDIKMVLVEIIKEKGTEIVLNFEKLQDELKKYFSLNDKIINLILQMVKKRLTWEILKIINNRGLIDEKILLDKIMKNLNVDENDARILLNLWIEVLQERFNKKESNITNHNSEIDNIYNEIIIKLTDLKKATIQFNQEIQQIKQLLEQPYQQANDLVEIFNSIKNSVDSDLRSKGINIDMLKRKYNYPIYTSNIKKGQLLSYYFKNLQEIYDMLKNLSQKLYDSKNFSLNDKMGGTGCLYWFFTFIIISFLISMSVSMGSLGWGLILIFLGLALFNYMWFKKNFPNEYYIQFLEYCNLFDYNLECLKVAPNDNQLIADKKLEKINTSFKNFYGDINKYINSVYNQYPSVFNSLNKLNKLKFTDNVLSIIKIGELDLNFLNYKFSLPAIFKLENNFNLLYRTTNNFENIVINNIKTIILKLLVTLPPGKVLFTFIDPIGLGNNFSEFLSLADYDESLINIKPWSNQEDINKKLDEIIINIENIIQKYLRNQYKNIEEYNKEAGELAEPYRFIFICDFPTNFNEESIKKLVNIIKNGPRCGIHTIIIQDLNKQWPYRFEYSNLENNCIKIDSFDANFKINEANYDYYKYSPDLLPNNDIINYIIKNVGEIVKTKSKVEISYEKVVKEEIVNFWDKKSNKNIVIPIGITSGKKIQNLILGEGVNHHLLIVGQTGSGKSNLTHIIVTTGALLYHPDELEFYLIDFKQGVEFKPYAKYQLPHCKVVAIASEREFGLSVLKGLDDEISRRGEEFRKVGVDNIYEYREKTKKSLPRILLIIDEFQKFFSEEDHIAVEARSILDRLAREGRSFGVNIILSTQSLSGPASNIARSTLSQFETRIVLKCSDTDSRLALSDDNSQARLLSRVGEAIYNNKGGLKEGNTIFQIAYLREDIRDKYLKDIIDMKNRYKINKSPIVFEGSEPSQLETCIEFNNLINKQKFLTSINNLYALIGEPISLDSTLSLNFTSQGGNNLLLIIKEEKEAVGIIFSSILSLSLQIKPENCIYHIVDMTSVEESWCDIPEDLQKILPHKIEIYGKRDINNLFFNLKNLIDSRITGNQITFPKIFLIILGAHRIQAIRSEDIGYSFNQSKAESLNDVLKSILREGPEFGIHTIIWIDSYTNFERIFNRRDLSEFSMRIVGRMNSSDSLNLIEDSAASKIDKDYRLIYYNDNQPGLLKKFRPFDIPSKEFIKNIGFKLRNFK